MDTLFEAIETKGTISSWTKMLDTFSSFAVAGLVIILVVPLASGKGKGTVVCTPIAFIVVAGLFVKPIMLSYKAASELEQEAASLRVPDWINECIDSNVDVDMTELESSRSDIEGVVT